MKVIKDIDIKNLKEVFKRQIDLAINKGYANVNINFVTALRILYVLEETQIREEKYQTIEIDRPVIGMNEAKMIAKNACDAAVLNGTQTNEMELHNKTDANGNVLRGVKAYEKISKMVANFQKEHGVIPKCFGTFSCDRNMDKCFKCESVKECCMKANSENKAPNCFRHYDDKDSKCDNCEAKAGCAIATEEKEKEEAKKKSCFGSYQDCYMCTHCIDYEKCKKETAKIKSGEDKVEINSKPERSDCCRINGRVPVCYGCYYEKGLYCPDCKSRESCVELTINREKDIEEDDDFI